MFRTTSLPSVAAGASLRAIDADALVLSQSRAALLEPAEPLRAFADIESRMTSGAAFKPVRRELQGLFERVSREPIHGSNADYIEALRDCDPTRFGVSVVTRDGGQLSFGDAHTPFTIQSISKPLDHLMALADAGPALTSARVRCRTSALPFNAPATAGLSAAHASARGSAATGAVSALTRLKTPATTSLLRERLKPFGDPRPANAALNFGALACTSLIEGESIPDSRAALRERSDRQVRRTLSLIERIAARKGEGEQRRFERHGASRPCATVDPLVFRSEIDDSAGNQTLARLVLMNQRRARGMQSVDALDSPHVAEEAFHLTEAYTKNCAVSMHAAGLAAAFAPLANRGVSPFTGQRVIDARHADAALAHMTVNGLYEATPEFVNRTGFIAKTGVGGGIVAIDPATGLTVASYSTPLDPQGNSERGMAFLEALAASPAYAGLRSAALQPSTMRDPRHRCAVSSSTVRPIATSNTRDCSEGPA